MKRVNLNKLKLSPRMGADNASFIVKDSLRRGDAYQVGNTAYVGRPPVYQTLPGNPAMGIPDRIVKTQKGIPFIRVGTIL